MFQKYVYLGMMTVSWYHYEDDSDTKHVYKTSQQTCIFLKWKKCGLDPGEISHRLKPEDKDLQTVSNLGRWRFPFHGWIPTMYSVTTVVQSSTIITCLVPILDSVVLSVVTTAVVQDPLWPLLFFAYIDIEFLNAAYFRIFMNHVSITIASQQFGVLPYQAPHLSSVRRNPTSD